MCHTFSRSTNPTQALRAEVLKLVRFGDPLFLAAFMTQPWRACFAVLFGTLGIIGCSALGSSWIFDRKPEASLYGTEKASAVSCEIGDNGFSVDGIDLVLPLSGM